MMNDERGTMNETLISLSFIVHHSAFIISEIVMADLIYVALTIVFFLLALAYVRGCERLQ